MTKKSRMITLVLGALVLAGTTAPALRAQDAKPFLGDWNGSISIAGIDLEISLHFTLDAEKKLAGTIDVPAQGASGLALADLKFENKFLTFTITNIPGEPPVFKVSLDETGLKMTGTLNQNGMDGTLTAAKAVK